MWMEYCFNPDETDREMELAQGIGCLPVFKRESVGAMHWGLVNGKTQTHLNWGHLPGQPEPEFWQHDLFRSDHSAYNSSELAIFRAALGNNSDKRKINETGNAG